MLRPYYSCVDDTEHFDYRYSIGLICKIIWLPSFFFSVPNICKYSQFPRYTTPHYTTLPYNTVHFASLPCTEIINTTLHYTTHYFTAPYHATTFCNTVHITTRLNNTTQLKQASPGRDGSIYNKQVDKVPHPISFPAPIFPPFTLQYFHCHLGCSLSPPSPFLLPPHHTDTHHSSFSITRILLQTEHNLSPVSYHAIFLV